MHTNDPASVTWIVTIVGRKNGDVSPRVVEERSACWPGFPARGHAASLSAWSVPYSSGSDYCHIEIDDGQGAVHIVGNCFHRQGKPNAQLLDLLLPTAHIDSEAIASHWFALPDGCLLTTIESDEGIILAALTTHASYGLELSVRTASTGRFVHAGYFATVEDAAQQLADAVEHSPDHQSDLSGAPDDYSDIEPPADPLDTEAVVDVERAVDQPSSTGAILQNADGLLIEARFSAAGDLEVAGQDLRPPVGFGRDDEYEYWITVASAHMPNLVTALGGVDGDDVISLMVNRRIGPALATWLRDVGIPFALQTR